MNGTIPVILVITALFTGSLVNTYSLDYSEKPLLGQKKIFFSSFRESVSGKARNNRAFEGCKGTIASSGTIDAEGNKISHEYDGFNRKTLTTRYLKNGEKIETSFTYYDNNLPKTITDDKGNITEYKFDDQKRLKKIIYPDESYIEITYTKVTKDENDYKRVIIKQRNGTIVTNDYDKLGRLVNRTIQKGEDVEGTTFENFDYDGLNRLTYAENDNFVVEFKFDPLNRITEEKQRGKLLNYTYSVVNNLRRMTMKYPNDRLIEKNFDLLDRLSNIKQGDNEIANFKYIGRSYRLLSKQFGNGDAVSYLYDQGRRMTSKEAKNKNSDLINKYVYGYNKVHMKTYEQRMHENGIGDVFGYDAVYRLTNAKFNVPDPTVSNPTDFERERSILLDHLDNITRIDETKNGETTQITTAIPPDTDYFKLNQYSRFDQWGLGYDKNGNLTQKSTQKMYHDYRNQMVRVTEGTTTTENKYDALGRRLQMIVNTGSQTKTENYYYSGHQVIEVRDGSDQVKRQFIYGNGIDEVVRMDAYSGSAITSYYFHTNAIGSTTAVTDANGQVVERYKYGLFGMPTFMDAAGNVIPKSAIGNNILFQGREYEPETNFYYFRARHLDPIMGRFLQTDPMGYRDSMNLYQSFNMNPVNFIDPFGNQYQVTVTPQGAEFGPNMSFGEYWKFLREECGLSIDDTLDMIAHSPYYSKYFWDGSLVNRIRTQKMETTSNVFTVTGDWAKMTADEVMYDAALPYLLFAKGTLNRDAGYMAAAGGALIFEALGGKAISTLFKKVGKWALKKVAPKLFEKMIQKSGKQLLKKADNILPLDKLNITNKAVKKAEKGAATVDELIEMMNKRPDVNAKIATGDDEAFLKAMNAEGSHMLDIGHKSHILIRKDVATRHTVFHEWLHHVLQKINGEMTPGEDDIIESFLERFKNLLKL